MDAQLKEKWVEALRSGEHQQCTGFFQSGMKFCALGILCKVAGVPVLIENGSGNWPFVDEALPVRPEVLASMNDEGKTFSEIADYIEANL
jgi:hypothetical protein